MQPTCRLAAHVAMAPPMLCPTNTVGGFSSLNSACHSATASCTPHWRSQSCHQQLVRGHGQDAERRPVCSTYVMLRVRRDAPVMSADTLCISHRDEGSCKEMQHNITAEGRMGTQDLHPCSKSSPVHLRGKESRQSRCGDILGPQATLPFVNSAANCLNVQGRPQKVHMQAHRRQGVGGEIQVIARGGLAMASHVKSHNAIPATSRAYTPRGGGGVCTVVSYQNSAATKCECLIVLATHRANQCAPLSNRVRAEAQGEANLSLTAAATAAHVSPV